MRGPVGGLYGVPVAALSVLAPASPRTKLVLISIPMKHGRTCIWRAQLSLLWAGARVAKQRVEMHFAEGPPGRHAW